MPDENQSSAGNEAEEKNNAASTESEEDEKKGEDGAPNVEKKEGEEGEGEEEQVTISKKEHDNLKAIAERKGTKKPKKSRPKAVSKPGVPFSFEKPAEPNVDESTVQNEQEMARFNNGVLRSVLKNKDYQKVLETDKTLAKMVENNPFALIEGQPVDADDALDQFKEFLDERVDELGTEAKPKEKKEEKKEDGDGKREPKPPKKVEVKNSEQKPEDRKTLDDVSKGIMSKVSVDGK